MIQDYEKECVHTVWLFCEQFVNQVTMHLVFNIYQMSISIYLLLDNIYTIIFLKMS